MADNCTDGTVAVAREFGVETFETEDNEHKKGGALNQALAKTLPGMGPGDVVMVMDADTRICPRYLQTAAARFDADPDLEAVAASSSARPGTG